MQDGASKAAKKLRGKARQRAKATSQEKQERIQKLARAVGNNETKRRITQGNASRDLMLAYICKQLQTIHSIQAREIAATERGSHWHWWRQVADAYKPWYSKPEPTRWKETALMFELATKALCGGQLGRGTQLLEKAIAEEEKQIQKTSAIIPLEDVENDYQERPTMLLEIVESDACGECDMPSEVKLAREIMDVSDEIPDPMNRKRRRDPWWTLEEEEEEEEDVVY